MAITDPNLLLSTTTVTIESFGGGTLSTKDNTTAVNDAAAYLKTKGGGTILFGPGTYNFTVAPKVIPAGVRLKGEGIATRLKLTFTATTDPLVTPPQVRFLNWQGSINWEGYLPKYTYKVENTEVVDPESDLILLSKVEKDASTIRFKVQKQRSNKITAGSLIYISRVRNVAIPSNDNLPFHTLAHSVILRPLTVAGDDLTGYTITFDGRIPFEILPTEDRVEIHQLVPAYGGGVEDMVLDGSDANAPNVHGIYALRTANQYFNGVRFEGWTAEGWPGKYPLPNDQKEPTSSGLFIYGGYENVIGNLSFYNCGSHPAGDLNIARQTALRVGQIRSEACRFGVLISQSSYCVVDSVIATGSHVRGVKLAGAVRCTINSIIADRVQHTACAFAWAATDNIIGMIAITDTSAAKDKQSVGVWFADTFNTNNVIGQVRVENCAGNAIEVYTTDTGNVIGNVVTSNGEPLKFENKGNAFIGSINGFYRPGTGHQFGHAVSDALNAPSPQKTNLVLHNATATSWSGIGCNGGGEIYFVTGAGNSPASSKAMLTTQVLDPGETALYLLVCPSAGVTALKQVELGPSVDGYRVLRVKG